MLKIKIPALPFILVLLCTTTCIQAQDASDNNNRFYFFKVWGLLKYNHPAIATGKVDADSLFLHYLPTIDQAKTKRQSEAEINKLLQSLGSIGSAKAPIMHQVSSDLLKNVDQNWYRSSKYFTAPIRRQLQEIYDHRYTGSDHHYYMTRHFDVNLPNEKAYNFADTAALPYAYRMLTLAKIQATVDYLFPHKYLMDENWNEVVQQSIPRFMQAKSRRDYEKELLVLTAHFNDTHANTLYKNLKYGKAILKVRYFPPFDYVLVNDGKQILVTKIIIPDLCAEANLKPGDVILKMNGITVEERIRDLGVYLSASNASALQHQLSNYLDNLLFITDSLHANLTFNRGGEIKNTNVEWVSRSDDINTLSAYVREQISPKMSGKDLEFIGNGVVIFRAGETIRFLNAFAEDKLGAGMDSLFTIAGKQKGMIFDMRKYPDWGGFLPSFLYNRFGQDTIPYAQFYALNKQHVSTFRLLTNNIDYYPPAAKPGMHNYPGKVVILVNGNTRSLGEHNTMLLQHMFPRSVTIGTQSAGADGDVVRLTLPGGNKLEFSGNAIFYPDRSEIQRSGVKIDKVIHPAIKDLVQQEDTLVKEALRLIRDDQ